MACNRDIFTFTLPNILLATNVIRMIKSMRMRWAENVARIGRRGMHIGCWWENQKEIEY
jgi:hypothetical protein